MAYGNGSTTTFGGTGGFEGIRGNGRKAKPVISSINKSIGYDAAVNTLLLDISKTASEQEGAVKSGDISEVRVRNTGDVAAWAMFRYAFWSAAATDGAADYLVHYLLLPDEEIRLPATRAIIGDAGIEPYAGTAVSSTAFNSNLYTDSGTTLGENVEDSDVDFDVADGDYFRVGDYIQLGINETTATRIEIMEVTAISTNNLTVKRALFGTSAADKDSQTNATSGAVSGAKVYFPHRNAYHDYDRYTVVQTDGKGRFRANNFGGYGRAATALMGIVPSSVAIQFYESGYQGLTGKSDISANISTGLTASQEYRINITVDGGTEFSDLTFTTDSSNTKFGGSNGLISKIQGALDTQYYTAGNLFEKKVTVGIENGDVVFRSGSRLSTSAIALANPDGGTNLFGVGRIPAVGSIPAAVSARLAPEQEYNPITDAATYKDIFIRDSGRGRLFSNGLGNGKISYESGKFEINGCPPNAEFVVSLIHTSAFSGKIDSVEATKQNSLQAVYGNVPSQKKSGTLKVTTY